MSFVGPRPERPMFVDELAAQIPLYRERHMVKAGLTGWAQVNYPVWCLGRRCAIETQLRPLLCQEFLDPVRFRDPVANAAGRVVAEWRALNIVGRRKPVT